jgi:hypothetical protein
LAALDSTPANAPAPSDGFEEAAIASVLLNPDLAFAAPPNDGLLRVPVGFDVSPLDRNTRMTLKALFRAGDEVAKLREVMDAPGALFPEDASPDEIAAYVQRHPEQRAEFESLYTVVRRTREGFKAVPYSVAFRDELKEISKHLEKAADITDDAPLRRYLKAQIKAFRTNDFAPSHQAWLDMTDSKYEAHSSFIITDAKTFGPEEKPYPTRMMMDMFFGLKDLEYTRRFDATSDHQAALDRALPLAEGVERWETSARRAPMVAYQMAFETPSIPIWEAWALPDDAALRPLGSKKGLALNVMAQNFAHVNAPIARELLVPEQAALVDLDSTSMFVNFHEVGHTLGPSTAKLADGSEVPLTTVFVNFARIEEPKADATALFQIDALIRLGAISEAQREQYYASGLANLVRLARAPEGLDHTMGARANLGFLQAHGAVTPDANGRMRIDVERFPEVARMLVKEWITFERRGDIEGLEAFIARYSTLSPELAAVFERVNAAGVPPLDGMTADFTVRDQL